MQPGPLMGAVEPPAARIVLAAVFAGRIILFAVNIAVGCIEHGDHDLDRGAELRPVEMGKRGRQPRDGREYQLSQPLEGESVPNAL